MIDFNFQNRLITHRFERYSNDHDLGNIKESNLTLLNPTMMPLVKLGQTTLFPKLPHSRVTLAINRQFRNRPMNRDKVFEIVNTANFPLLLTVTSVHYYIGKGFIALAGQGDTTNIDPLFVACVPDINYQENETKDITILVDSRYKEQPAIIKSVVSQLLNEHPGDIIITGEIKKFLSGKIKLPRFSTINDKKIFTEQLIEQCVGSL